MGRKENSLNPKLTIRFVRFDSEEDCDYNVKATSTQE